MSSKRKNFYISSDLLSHLENQPNQSYYINQLIRKDINNSQPLTKTDIIKLIRDYIPQSSNQQSDELSNSIGNILKFD